MKTSNKDEGISEERTFSVCIYMKDIEFSEYKKHPCHSNLYSRRYLMHILNLFTAKPASDSKALRISGSPFKHLPDKRILLFPLSCLALPDPQPGQPHRIARTHFWSLAGI
ncbi:hypothetical protein ACCY16_17355 [Candidatus Pantoea formicae]|uniref:hypothetical protein n=1 Tax=Candidatus Pantoea formicae TaxID=2608355 RepID=UPI003ED9F53E